MNRRTIVIILTTAIVSVLVTVAVTSWRQERAREEAFEQQVRAWYLAHPQQMWEEEWLRAHPDAGLLDAGLP
jgi:hypothetical protein